MTEIKIIKNNEKILIWLHRERKTQVWLAKQLRNQSRQAISNKMTDNSFTSEDIQDMKCLGILTD